MSEALTPPPQLLRSRQLWVASSVVGLVAVVLRLLDRRGISDMLGQFAPQLTMAQVDGAVSLAVVMAVLFRLGLIALFWWLATRMVQGAEAPRVVLTVLGGMSVGLGLIGVLGLLGGASAALAQLGFIQVTLSVVIFALDVGALVMMFHPTSRAYFTGVRRTRPGNTPA
ncbi:hypothetical protein N8J89_39150 [Crossiella sp. CA-258035]|uniref:hypothetical protein n=1 Tax=Crossiella sp. CA-258035 TaxID=2981138 RepID=UPI0024BCAEE4|nr:hypothetical protein [Crossiella sp. CA-258035]WHT19045.1 hypothetical protein N8J89_39150 [Crossiella sp. CA-258035]